LFIYFNVNMYAVMRMLVLICDSYYICFMLTIEQTVTVSDDHRVYFDLPPELPVGRAKMKVTVTPFTDISGADGKIRLSKSMIDKMMQEETLQSLTGLLHTTMNAEEIRTERLRKYEHTS